MERFNVTFYDETCERLKTRMQKKNEKSIAQGIRTLVDLGMKTEEAIENNDKKNDGNDIEKLMEIMKKNLIWMLETRLLSRYLVDNLSEDNKEKHTEILEKYKQSAIDYIEGMFDEKNK